MRQNDEAGMKRSIAAGSLLAAAAIGAAPSDDTLRARARLHREAIVVDTHEDVPFELADKWADVAIRGATRHFDIPRAREGGLHRPFFAVYGARLVRQDRRGGDEDALAHRPRSASHRRGIPPISPPPPRSPISGAKAEGRIAIPMGSREATRSRTLAALRDYYRLGVRYMTLTHTNTDHCGRFGRRVHRLGLCSIRRPRRVHGGSLPRSGASVVREMNRIGMMVDVSCTFPERRRSKTSGRLSRARLLASLHSRARALSDIPRNLTDDQMPAAHRQAGRGWS